VFARCEGGRGHELRLEHPRVQQALDAAAALDRKVALIGRSMRKNVGIGRSLGHIEVPEVCSWAPGRSMTCPMSAS